MSDRHQLKKSSDFRRVYGARRRRDGQLLAVYSRPNQLSHPRIGLSVSTKVGGAVVRNTIKRRLRVVCRAWLEAARAEPLDLVVVARPEASAAPFDALSQELQVLLGAVPVPPPNDLGAPPPLN